MPDIDDDLEDAPIGQGVTPRCKAKSKSTGRRCKNAALKGRHLCRLHGGKQAVGMKNHNSKTGMYSKFLNNDIQGTYEKILNDAELMSLREEIALLKTLLARELENSQEGGSPRTWTRLKNKWNKFMVAVQSGNTDKQTELLFDLDEYIQDSYRVEEAIREVKNISVPLSRLIKTHNQLLTSRDQMMPMDQVMALFGVVLQGFREAVYARIDEKEHVSAIMLDAERRFERTITPKAITTNK